MEEAARQITDDEAINDKALKTKIRRLYDIANVLQSIGLIEKTHMSTNRKPAFRWIGIEGVYTALKEIKAVVNAQKPPANHAMYTMIQPPKMKKWKSQISPGKVNLDFQEPKMTTQKRNKRTHMLIEEESKPNSAQASTQISPNTPLGPTKISELGNLSQVKKGSGGVG